MLFLVQSKGLFWRKFLKKRYVTQHLSLLVTYLSGGVRQTL